jgi:hypothetical protein
MLQINFLSAVCSKAGRSRRHGKFIRRFQTGVETSYLDYPHRIYIHMYYTTFLDYQLAMLNVIPGKHERAGTGGIMHSL